MLEFKKKDTYHFWHSPLSLGILFCLLVLFSYNMINLIEKERDTSKQRELALVKLDTAKAREQALSEDITKLKTPEGVESTIREKYQVAKAGEKMVQIVDDNSTPQALENTAKEHGFWAFIKKLFTK